jgi:hypothetical protein
MVAWPATPKGHNPRLFHSAQTSRRFLQVILPSDPARIGVDLSMSLARDLQFPVYSFIGAGAFGQVSGHCYCAAYTDVGQVGRRWGRRRGPCPLSNYGAARDALGL